MAGVVIMQNSAAPGGGVSVRVRGVTSGQSNEPLYVIDGLPVYNDNSISVATSIAPSGGGQSQNVLATLNPSDIESISVLKDASATSVYGARGANGVVLITTKRGKSGKTRVSFDTYQGLQEVANRYDLLNAREFAQLSKEAAENDGLKPYQGNDPSFPDIPPFFNPDLVEREFGEGTDWQEEILRRGKMQNYQLSISSGTEKSQFAIMTGYFTQKGVVENSDFQRYSLRINSNTKVTSWMNIGASVSLTRAESDIIPTDGVEGSSVVITPALSYLPVIRPRDENGNYSTGTPSYFAKLNNPLIGIYLNENTTNINRALGSIFSEFTIWKKLRYKINFGFDYNAHEGTSYAPRYTTTGGINPEKSGRVKAGNTENMWLVENTLNWNKSFADHSIDAMAGYSAQSFSREGEYLSVMGFPNEENTTVTNAIEILDADGGLSEYSLLSMFGRINYHFKGKYLASFTLRRDGSSRFGKNNRFGVFPAFSAGWRLVEEPFLSLPSGISELKLRYSYGRSGNQEIGNYWSSMNMVSPEIAYAFGYAKYLGTWPLSIPIDDLSWEETTQHNAGLDLGIFNSRFELTLDFYKKHTEGVLVQLRPPVLSGYADEYWKNSGVIENKGIEFLLSGRIISTSNFRWLSDLNMSVNDNTIVEYPGGEGEGKTYEQDQNGLIGLTLLKNGEALGNFYGLETEGIFESQQEIDNYNKDGELIQPRASVGDIKFVDQNNDGIIDSEDRTIIGNAFPDAVIGFTNRFNYKSFELSIFLFSILGNEVYNQTRSLLEGMTGDRNQTANVLNRWRSPEDPGDGVTPRASRLDLNYNRRPYTDRWIEDGSFLRIKNVTLSYTIPSNAFNKLSISNTKVYLTGQNLYTFTSYSGFDPEISSNGQSAYFPGYDLGGYPRARTVLVGLTVTF
ncbi:MAG: SusC/RagA family TonB-linked outer membrane protein, partial [bacterium]